jgi:hypothetical protein
MPNRIIKESICTSENIDQLTPFQETVFIRLMVNCDDFGRFDGRPKVLASRLFPLKDITREEIEDALTALVNADLVRVVDGFGKPVVVMNTWAKHQRTRATESKYPLPSDNCGQLPADDGELLTTADKCARNRNRNTINDNRYSESLIGEADAVKITEEQNRVLDAAEDAGFKVSNDVRAALIDLFAEHGLEKMLAAMKSCVEYGVTNIAYLKAVLSGKPKKPKSASASADFEQRDYSGEQDAAMERMMAWGKDGETA